ncbi:cyclopropane-fatty-acyl-phospholipid synthase family protein [uncultured Sneathiella sp.]|jgi:cyclopropane-fatty-acyl-phospholipid synthase|uniref:cyclopropane-fatty-acyl-phospholipid synthase family protein n=1 Tax=uncultured Sneathiella sp. TaxID=879315 RepID=UPI0030DC823C|tara:strand:+ start:17439 stop:18683 length:1245 start_codon:yes stop_codon:yes gene_type:complete
MTDITPQPDMMSAGREKRTVKLSQLGNPWIKALTYGLSRIAVGQLTLILPTGERLVFGPARAEEPRAMLHLHTARAARRMIRSGNIGLGEGYMAGDWSSPDVRALIELAILNEKKLNTALLGRWRGRLVHFIRDLRTRNSRSGSRRNIAYHYDLGNEFYGHWLDETMTYSAALFTETRQSLGEAQRQKYRRIAELANLDESSRVLEIGCGWGGFARLAATEYGAHVDGITLSAEQLTFAREASEKAELTNQTAFHYRDYRDQNGTYDAIVSIEMFEAVGEEHWSSYFKALKRNLASGGRAIVQVITIDEKRFAQNRNTADFIQRYIFPGGKLPSKTAFIEAAAKGGLTATIREEFGGDYATTLNLWREKFLAKWPEIEPLGFDQRFKRMWDYYLQYCEAGFRRKSIDVAIFELR